MKIGILMIAAGAFALAPAVAAPGHSHGPTTGKGWVHMNGPTEPAHDVECGEEDATRLPGHAADARGSPFNEDGVAGTKYAGEQPQNSRNGRSVSQYDLACAGGPPTE
ncbi:hypothetical protein [Sphingomonas alba]|uniref:Uncharacterized protein n=1 Tax=Sphingomonas alba TaxID=2908208 RepID=A0ABT0RN15_9SPHN|nr:hypothetical protein [Sphingomonas alba]MCL6684023.1 hypothetical protein [Sphingomonas alba]